MWVNAAGDAWPVVGSHVQRDDGLRGVVTKSEGAQRRGLVEVTTKTGYSVFAYRADLTKITLSAEEAALCDRSRLTPNEWVQNQLDGAVCTTSEGRLFGNCFATKDGRTQRTFTVETNGDVRCVLCDWTARSGEPSALQNDLSAWGKWFSSIKVHCGHFASALTTKATRQHVERVLAMAVEPSTELPPAKPTAQYSVESLVEARFRGGDVFYPALVVAVRDGGRTLDLKYTDGDSEKRVPLDLVRPLAARQRSAPAADVPEVPPAAPKTSRRWTAEEEQQLRKLVNELGATSESWSAIAARIGSHRSASACEWHWRDLVKGRTRAAPANTIVAGGTKPCEVRRGNGPWRRFASQADAFRTIPALDQSSISGLINESRDGIRRSTVAVGVRGEYEARDYAGDDFEAAKPVTRRPPPAAPAEDATAPLPTNSVSYPVDALVEARWRGGSRFYPALVIADDGRTVHVKYCDDSDEEEEVPVGLVRPANRRLLQRYEEVAGKRPPPNLMLPPPPPPMPSSPTYAKGAKCIVPWSDGRKYAATVVSSGPTSARVAFEDGALKTVPLEELEPLSTPAPVHPSAMEVTTVTSQQSATGDIRCTSGRPDCYCQHFMSRAIVRYDPSTGEDLEEYCSVGAAADKLDISGSSISDNIAGRTQSTVAGHAFRYKTPPPPRTKKIPEALPAVAPPPPPLLADRRFTRPAQRRVAGRRDEARISRSCMSTITEDACILECGHAFHAACLGDLADHVRLSARTRRSLGVACPLCRKVTRAEVGPEED